MSQSSDPVADLDIETEADKAEKDIRAEADCVAFTIHLETSAGIPARTTHVLGSEKLGKWLVRQGLFEPLMRGKEQIGWRRTGESSEVLDKKPDVDALSQMKRAKE